MKKMTRAQINERLEKLRQSRLDDASYTIARPAMAMCYYMSMPRVESVTRSCSTCGQSFEIDYLVYGRNEKNVIEKKENIVEQFRNAGLDARFICNCPSCVEKQGLTPFEIWVKSAEETEWHKSKPAEIDHCADNEYTSDFEYELVLRFLTAPEKITDLAKFFDELYNIKFRTQELEFYVGKELIESQPTAFPEEDKQNTSCSIHREKRKRVIADSNLFYSGKKPIDFYKEKDLTVAQALKLIKKDTNLKIPDEEEPSCLYYRFMDMLAETYRELTYKGLFMEESKWHYQDAGFIKTKIDTALHKVLGLNNIYDIEEVRKNIACIWGEHERAELLPLAYKALEKTKKTQFTLSEYKDFMEYLRENISCLYERTLNAADSIICSEITQDTTLVCEILSHLKREMAKLNEYEIDEDKLKDYLHNEIFPAVRFDFSTVENVFKKQHSDFLGNNRYDYFDSALKKFIAYSSSEDFWRIDMKEVETLKEGFMNEKNGILAPLYKREEQKEFSIQDVIDIQEEINQTLAKCIEPPRIGIMREKETQ